MALIACPECGNEISDKADVCPCCGYPLLYDEVDYIMPQSRSNVKLVDKIFKPIVTVSTVIIFVCLAAIIYSIVTDSKTEDPESWLIAAAAVAIDQNVPSPKYDTVHALVSENPDNSASITLNGSVFEYPCIFHVVFRKPDGADYKSYTLTYVAADSKVYYGY